MQGEPTPGTVPGPATEAEQPLAARLLYVEDNVLVADVTRLMLDDSGLEVIHAASAEEALATIGETEGPPPFDIVLTDVVMPGLSGVQLARRLNRRWPNLPIVLVSGFSEELAMGYGREYELIRKPFTRGALVESLRRHLDNSPCMTA